MKGVLLQTIPIALQEEVFGLFLDDLESISVDRQTCEFVSQLVDQLSGFPRNEKQRQLTFNRLLTIYLASGRITPFQPNFRSDSQTDGTLIDDTEQQVW